MNRVLLAGLLLASAVAGAYDPPAQPKLPPPNATPSIVKHPKVIGWPAGKTPTAPTGFKVTLYADGFDSPRWLYVLPDGDVLVAEARTLPKKDAKPEVKEGVKKSKTVTGGSANRITRLRDADRDGGRRHRPSRGRVQFQLPPGVGPRPHRLVAG